MSKLDSWFPSRPMKLRSGCKPLTRMDCLKLAFGRNIPWAMRKVAIVNFVVGNGT